MTYIHEDDLLLPQRLARNFAERPFVKLKGTQIHAHLNAVFFVDLGRYSP